MENVFKQRNGHGKNQNGHGKVFLNNGTAMEFCLKTERPWKSFKKTERPWKSFLKNGTAMEKLFKKRGWKMTGQRFLFPI